MELHPLFAALMTAVYLIGGLMTLEETDETTGRQLGAAGLGDGPLSVIALWLAWPLTVCWLWWRYLRRVRR